jgi:predicted anti-sigma-YlaC factor YlaD
MLTPIPASECDRAREAASAYLDGDLSELDAAYLSAHRRGCEACDDFAAGIEATTAALRATPLIEPSRPLVIARLQRPARQLTLRAATGLAAAAAVLAFVAGHVLQPSSSHTASRGAVAAVRLAPARVPQPFSAFYSLSSPPPSMTRAGENVAI